MVEILSRLQFASVAVTHAILLSLSLGGALLLAFMQTSALRRQDHRLMDLVRWWGGLYVVNYVVGIGAGMLLELQFGLGFPGLVDRAGNVVGAMFALETLTTFVVESTALAAWVFGFAVLPRRVHVALIWVVAISALMSAFWALLANGFLQHPEGYAIDNGEVRLTDPWAVLSGPELWVALGHISGASLVAAGFAVAGVSSWWLLRSLDGDSLAGTQAGAFVRSARIGLAAAAAGALVAVVFGVSSLAYLADVQPAKRAALLEPGGSPGLMAELMELYGPGSWSPPAWIIVPFIVMVSSALALFAVAVFALSGDPDSLDDSDDSDDGNPRGADTARPVADPEEPVDGVYTRIPFTRRMATVLMLMAPLPLVTIASGWLVREVGRQPWVITGVLTTSEAVSGRGAVAAAWMLAVVVVVCVSLLVLDVHLLSGMVRRSFDRYDSAGDANEALGVGATLRDAHPVDRVG